MPGTYGKVKSRAGKAKVSKVMREFAAGTLHSGKGGPVVTSPEQAKAIAMSEGRRAQRRKRGSIATGGRK